jgi:hypothetical protein
VDRECADNGPEQAPFVAFGAHRIVAAVRWLAKWEAKLALVQGSQLQLGFLDN